MYASAVCAAAWKQVVYLREKLSADQLQKLGISA